LPHGFHPQNPLSNAEVLDSAEVVATRIRIDELNTTITQLATDYNLALADMNDFLESIRTGTAITSTTTNAAYISGNAFSLDGVHLTPRGNALAANRFINAINAKYGSSIPTLNESEYRGTLFPNQ
jgi:lysophospholipase L1-like esterase